MDDPSIVGYRIVKADARPLARLHRAAFPDFFLSRLGEAFLVQFYLGFVTDPTAVVAISRDPAGIPRGVAVGTTDPVGFYRRLLRRRLFGFAVASSVAALRDPLAAPRLLSALAYRGSNPPGRTGALLGSIGVDPAWSGRGIGSALINGWTRQARRMGAETAFLTTDAIDNDPVNSWYRREGWVLCDCYDARPDRPMNRYEYDLLSIRDEVERSSENIENVGGKIPLRECSRRVKCLGSK